MIVAFEGAPGVGKSTTAAALSASGAVVVPEVNLLFARPTPEPVDWYLDRQNARWEMAALQARHGRLAILDGDPFQPLWFGWIFREGPWVRSHDALQFYRQRILDGRLAFPDRYVFFTLPEPLRRQRLLERERARGFGEERAQQKAARYAPLVEPQRQYFDALTTRFPDWVVTLEPTSLEQSTDIIQALHPPVDASPSIRGSQLHGLLASSARALGLQLLVGRVSTWQIIIPCSADTFSRPPRPASLPPPQAPAFWA